MELEWRAGTVCAPFLFAQPKPRELAVAADDQVMPIGAVEAKHVKDDDALGRINDLTDAEKGFALGDAEQVGGARIGDRKSVV